MAHALCGLHEQRGERTSELVCDAHYAGGSVETVAMMEDSGHAPDIHPCGEHPSERPTRTEVKHTEFELATLRQHALAASNRKKKSVGLLVNPTLALTPALAEWPVPTGAARREACSASGP